MSHLGILDEFFFFLSDILHSEIKNRQSTKVSRDMGFKVKNTFSSATQDMSTGFHITILYKN